MTEQRLRAGYAGEFVTECPECEREIEFTDPTIRSGSHPDIEVTYHDEVRIECGESGECGKSGCGAEIRVTGFDVTVTPVVDGEDR